MYITKGPEIIQESHFEWDDYFKNKSGKNPLSSQNATFMFNQTRQHLRENQGLFGFVFHKFMKSLVAGIPIHPEEKILELGAATGFLTRWLVEQFNATGTLVGKSKEAYQAFLEFSAGMPQKLQYIQEDLFQLHLPEQYDWVCSFGVIEHFVRKKETLEAHKKFLSEKGHVLIIIPLDSPLTRAFYEVNFELNLGYRELLTEKEFVQLLREEGLEVLNLARSQGYAYDIIGAVCSIGPFNQAPAKKGSN